MPEVFFVKSYGKKKKSLITVRKVLIAMNTDTVTIVILDCRQFTAVVKWVLRKNMSEIVYLCY